MTVNVTIEVGTHSTLSQLVEARDLLLNLVAQRTQQEEKQIFTKRDLEHAFNLPEHSLTPPKVEENFGVSAETSSSEAVALAPPPAAPAKPRGRPSKPPVAKTYTVDEVRAVLVEKSKAGVEAVEKQRSMLHSMGYEKLSEVPIERYAELMEKAQAL